MQCSIIWTKRAKLKLRTRFSQNGLPFHKKRTEQKLHGIQSELLWCNVVFATKILPQKGIILAFFLFNYE